MIRLPVASAVLCGAIRTFSHWIANGTLRHPLLQGVDYSRIFREPSALEQVYAVFANVLEFDETGQVLNAKYAEKRAAQYILSYVARNPAEPRFESWQVELYEPAPKVDLK